MILATFGDSFPAGHIKYRTDKDAELGNREDNSLEERRKINFVTRMTRQLQRDLKTPIENRNFSIAGAGNFWIAQQVMQYISDADDLQDTVIFICWSSWVRYAIQSLNVYNRNIRKVDGTLSTGHSDQVTKFFKEKDPNYIPISEHVLYSEAIIHGLEHVLNERGISYKMTWSFQDANAFSNTNWHAGRDKRWTHKSFQWMLWDKDEYRPSWIEWNKWNNTLYDIISGDWLADDKSKLYLGDGLGHGHKPHKNKYITGCKHPTAEGHKLIAATLAPYFEEVFRYKMTDPYVYE